MKQYIFKYALLLGAVALWSCEPKVDEFTPSTGTADFSKFIAIGDSYTAGYTDGALGRRGQEESFSAILGKQLMYVGSDSYNQPFVLSESSVGSTQLQPGVFNGYYELNIVDGSLKPQPTVGDANIFGEQVASAENQNYGVPGAKLIHLLAEGFGNPAAGFGNYNPFYTRFMSQPMASVLGDALAAQASFISLWAGNNDVLAYAMAGGEGDAITDPAIFAGAYSQALTALVANGAKGVLGNIPAVETIPFFNTVPYNALPLDQATADMLNAAYTDYNAAADANGLPRIEFSAGANALVIADESWPLMGIRQIKADEKFLLTLPTDKIANEGWGTQVPVPAEYVLDATELAAIATATAEYNVTIKSLSEQHGFAHADLNMKMKELSTTGIIIDGHTYTGAFVTGGVFSLDGIHATGRGSAIIANAFIDAINAKFDASIPRANINDYNMVEFP
ncbi:SGNH/GDSL hydrolase family protein [Carboxylicivirga marina]|uniref:G-D-S-L family lipolytic protein n=1 Tax=Carboxylicivirga marina TaxID=2800988 RepID=A0ABS1HJD4_9BACT|nr:SGNH/GDSL hydrolase family protein [Carboxylicivirga marina]MBK3517784.1 hypothetical protein [Carboxylicivirga marina]